MFKKRIGYELDMSLTNLKCSIAAFCWIKKFTNFSPITEVYQINLLGFETTVTVVVLYSIV